MITLAQLLQDGQKIEELEDERERDEDAEITRWQYNDDFAELPREQQEKLLARVSAFLRR